MGFIKEQYLGFDTPLTEIFLFGLEYHFRDQMICSSKLFGCFSEKDRFGFYRG